VEDLVAFLRARYDEEAADARRALDRPDAPDGWMRAADLERACFEPADAVMVATYADPARVLAEVQAKRQLVDRYVWLRERGDAGDAAWVLPLLAAPYSSHPGYRPEWAPTA
jgi:hypothetical protein